MKSIVLFGAGQVGAMVSRLLGGDFRQLCFADNAEGKWGSVLAGLPVLSPQEALLTKPDCVCLCVTDAERAGRMEAQLRALGYTGSLLRADLLRLFDARAAVMRLLAEQILARDIPGDAAEFGVYRGEFAALINAALPDRPIHLFDTFEGFAGQDVAVERAGRFSHAEAGDFADTALTMVESRLPHPELARFHVGWFPDSFASCEACRFSLVSIDADLYAPTAAALPLFWDRLSPGGALLVHDVNGTQYAGAGKAVREFCGARGILPVPVPDLHGSVILAKPPSPSE